MIAMFAIASVSLTGCFSSRPAVQTVSKQTFSFDYSPKETNKSGSANMLLAFVNPYYATDFTSGSGELFRNFQKAMQGDIQEIIVSKGFSLKGPYQEFGEMVFDDKKRTDMVIVIEIAPAFTAQEGGWNAKYHMNLLSPGASYNTYTYSGTASLVGKINLTGIEPLANEKIWTKSVSIPGVENIPIKTTNEYDHQLNSVELINDPGVYNALGKALMVQYAGIMDKITAHFSVDEFNSLRPQIKELKSKKGY
jgi:hypothetical protein